MSDQQMLSLAKFKRLDMIEQPKGQKLCTPRKGIETRNQKRD